MNNLISVTNLQKKYGESTIYNDLNFEIEASKITSIFGPNGSGKSTVLNILAGIVKKDGGVYEVKKFNSFEFSYIFQNYRDSLFPWKTNFENVAFPMELQGKDRVAVEKRVRELQKIFEFDFDWNGYPYALSGGQQQILAFLRALASNPKLLFIDEPFSALDYENNLRLRRHLQAYYVTHKPTIVLITHNIEEAVHLSHRILIFSKKPTTVSASVENTLPFPRTVESIKSPLFHTIKDAVLDAFRKTAKL